MTAAMPEALRAARRALEAVPGVELLVDGQWLAKPRLWHFRYRITVEIPDGLQVPPVTEWVVLVSENYPWGEIDFYPANDGRFVSTFPHQRPNTASPGAPFRRGNICVRPPSRDLDTRGSETEPFEAELRLRWHFERAKEWLTDAAGGQLMRAGEPFELPDYGVSGPRRFAFCEGSETLTRWTKGAQSGAVMFKVMSQNPRQLFVTRYRRSDGDIKIHWGHDLQVEAASEQQGAWVRLVRPPVLEPWAAPATWSELKAAVAQQGFDLLALLRGLPRMKPSAEQLLLLGFPIPFVTGQDNVRLHWQALTLPRVKKMDAHSKPPSHWSAPDLQTLLDPSPLTYMLSENWHDAELLTRGGLDATVRGKRFMLIGAGALGSAMVEYLVRAGVRRLVIVDGDSLSVGNLARHTLAMTDLGWAKASRLARHLNGLSPHVEAVAVDEGFHAAMVTEDALECDVVLDCTAENSVLVELSRARWRKPTTFVSLSVGWAARRLISIGLTAGAFPGGRVIEMLQPVMVDEIAARGDEQLPREGVGCWSVVFPARGDALAVAAACAVNEVSDAIVTPSAEPRLRVLEPKWTARESADPTRAPATETV